MAYLILNDLHHGKVRKTGVTTAANEAFRKAQEDVFVSLLDAHRDKDLIILGDLFDGYLVDYVSVSRVLHKLLDTSGRIILVAGNHDLSKNTATMSSFDFVCVFMENLRPDSVIIVKEPTIIDDHLAIIPHLINQEIFDQAVAKYAGRDLTLLAHCNYENPFAAEKDHSLNLTKKQAQGFRKVILGHEHVKRWVGNVRILGSQLPMTIQEAESDKYYHILCDDGALTEHLIWSTEDGYAEQDWVAMQDCRAKFIRIVGEASAEQAAKVLQEVNKFRNQSDAYLVANSVKVGDLVLEELEEAAADVETFDALAVFKQLLPEKVQERLNGLVKTVGA